MRYFINFDKTINQFVPHYLGGRKLILFLQALLKPLQSLNNSFFEWARETRIEASMTSQIFKFEWFLTRKLKKYFKNPDDKIVISNGIKLGSPIYYANADISQTDNMVLYTQNELTAQNTVLHYSNEQTDTSKYSFLVYSPEIDEQKISIQKYTSTLKYWIERYRLAGKTYLIKFSA